MKVQLEISDGRVFLAEAARATGSEAPATGARSAVTRHEAGPRDPDAEMSRLLFPCHVGEARHGLKPLMDIRNRLDKGKSFRKHILSRVCFLK